MREWPDEIVDVFQGANVAYEDVVTLEPDELFVAYLNAVGLCEWADHIVAVHAWCHTDPAVGDEMPEHLGQVADEYKRVSAIRLAMDKRAEAVKARESELKEYLIDNIDVDNEAGVMGMRYALPSRPTRCHVWMRSIGPNSTHGLRRITVSTCYRSASLIRPLWSSLTRASNCRVSRR
jgi:hypothetical protein